MRSFTSEEASHERASLPGLRRHQGAGGQAEPACFHADRAPFDPAAATAEIAKTLKAYGITKVIGDKYAAQWPVTEFARNDITYEHSERDRSAVYADFLPLLTSGRARLLDSPRLVGQLCNLERKASPMGRDRIDHPAGAHDDLRTPRLALWCLRRRRRPTGRGEWRGWAIARACTTNNPTLQRLRGLFR